RGDFAHYIDLKAVLSTRKTILRHDLEHTTGLVRSATEGNHHHNIGEAHFLPQAADCAAFQGKSISILWRVVARGSPEAEHRIFLLRLKLGAADQIGILIGLEIAHSHDHRLRIERGGNAREPEREPIDEMVSFVLIAAREL